MTPTEGKMKALRDLITSWVNDPEGFYYTFSPTHWMPLPEHH